MKTRRCQQAAGPCSLPSNVSLRAFHRRCLAACVLASLPWALHANCVLQADGSTVICDTSTPNPYMQSITAAPGAVGNLFIPASGATIIVQSGAGITTRGAAIQVYNNSSVLSQGTITTSLTNAYGMWAGDPQNAGSSTRGNGNTLENDGSIVTTGANAVGMYERGSNTTLSNTLINRGTIDTYGSIVGPSATASSAGIRSDSASNTTIFNYGRISAHGAYVTLNLAGSTAIGGTGASMGGPGVFTNAAGASITSDNAYGFYANGPTANGILLVNAGSISGKLGAILFADGLSNNTVTLQAGSNIVGSIDAGRNGTGNNLVFDGLVATDFSNDIPNWNVLAFRNGANVTFTAPGYALSTVKIDAGASATFASPQIGIATLIANDGSLTFDSANDQTIAAPIQGSGSLTQAGTGAVTLSGASSYTGTTTVAAGILRAGAVQAFAPLSAFTVNAGATLDLASTDQTTGSLAGAGSVTLGAGRLATGALNTSTTFSGVIQGSGGLTKKGSGTLILSGNNTYSGDTVITNGVVQLGDGGSTGSIVGNVQNGATLTFNRSDVYTFAGLISDWTATTPDPPGTVVQNGSGATILNALNTYTGTTYVNAGTLALGDASHTGAGLAGGGLTLVAPGATLAGYGSTTGDVDNQGTLAVADAAAIFQGAAKGNFTVGGLLSNAGLVQIGGAGTGNHLVVSSYFGKNATMALNSVLNGDASPTDSLVIVGGTGTGQTTLRINKVGGAGAVTGNGILVVQAAQGATTTADAFTLASPLAAGPYQYGLFRGSRDGSSADSWYLRSENPRPPVTLPGEVTETLTPPPPPTVPGEPGSPGGIGTPEPSQIVEVVPDYRPEVSLYTALPSMALHYGMTQLGTLHERLGDLATDRAQDAGAAGDAWARLIGQDGQWRADKGGIYANGPSFDDNMFAFQAGLNAYSARHDAGNGDRIDVIATIGHGHGGVDDFDGTSAGNDRFDAYSLGGTWTHFGSTAWYVDSVLQATWYHAKASSNQQQNLSTNGFGTTLSVEGGYPFTFDQGWSLEPQGQVIWQNIHFDSASDTAANVRFNDVHEWVARLGARVSDAWQTAGHPIHTWLVLNIWHAFDANPQTQFSSDAGYVPFHSDLSGSWWELGAGATTQLASHVSLYGQVGYEKGFSGGVKDINGTLGLRVSW